MVAKNRKGQTFPTKYILIFLFSFILLLILSEIVFSLTNPSRILNKPPLLVSYYLNRFARFNDKSEMQSALVYLGRAAEVKFKEVSQEYPELSIENPVEIPSLPENNQLREAYVTYLESVDTRQLAESHASFWAKPFYTLGLLAYKHGETELVIPFWQTATTLAPEWSYFHIELANYYLFLGELDKAQKQIEDCSQFKSPKNHCLQFEKENVETDSFMPVGFWEEQINDSLSLK